MTCSDCECTCDDDSWDLAKTSVGLICMMAFVVLFFALDAGGWDRIMAWAGGHC